MSTIRISDISSMLSRWDNLEVYRSPTETVLFGSPQNGPMKGWLHTIFGPICRADLDEFFEQNAFLTAFPSQNRFYQFNGANLFSDRFVLFGYQIGSKMDPMSMPWDIVIENIENHSLVSDFDAHLIGRERTYSKTTIYLEEKGGRILGVDQEKGSTVKSWESFSQFLRLEIERLGELYDDQGNCLED